jgi:hypothetical protein
MDIVPDANVILNDPQMQGNAFRSLLDYLKMTSSKIVLTKVVFDEVVARYPERLRPAVHKVKSAALTLKNLVSDPDIGVPDVDIDAEVKKLALKLLNPASGVPPTFVLRNFEKVRIEDVVARGIKRIPPANGAGEELRDVVHWLMVCNHARELNCEVAFITDDKHFRLDTALHPALKDEIEHSGIKLHFYASVDEFIKAHAPSPRELSGSETFELLGKTSVMDRCEIQVRRFFFAWWPNALSVTIVAREARLQRGALYEVAPQSQFGEFEFVWEIKTSVSTPVTMYGSVYTDNMFLPGNPIKAQGYAPATNFVYTAGIDDLPTNDLAVETYFPSRTVPIYQNASFETLSSLLVGTPNTRSYIAESVTEFDIAGTIVISVRRVSDKITNVETEKFEVTHFPPSR